MSCLLKANKDLHAELLKPNYPSAFICIVEICYCYHYGFLICLIFRTQTQAKEFSFRPPLWSCDQSSDYRSRGQGSIPGATRIPEE
jgi:hypothetical protein